MLSWLKSFLGSSETPPIALLQAHEVKGRAEIAQLPSAPDDDDPLADVPRYPPYDRGIPVKDVRLIVDSQRELLTRIFRTAGVSRDEFATHYQPAIENLARFVHLVPASSIGNHRGAGGLFRFALEIGLHGLQAANVAVFPAGGGVERRYAMQPKWMLGTFLAAICSQLYRTVNNMVILDAKNHQWSPLIQPLSAWAAATSAKAFFIRWTEDNDSAAAQASSAYLVNHIVRPETMQYLSGDNNIVVPAMSGTITGNPIGNGDNPIARIIIPTITRVVDADLKRSAINYGHLSVGMHLEPHLIDAMRRLLKSGTWGVNSKRGSSCLWLGKDGAYLVWPSAANDIKNLMMKDAFAGIPQDPDTLADILIQGKIIEPRSKKAKYWSIVLPESGEVVENALRLNHRELIFDASFDYAPFDNIILNMDGSPKQTPPPAAAAPSDAAGPDAPTEPAQQSQKPLKATGATTQAGEPKSIEQGDLLSNAPTAANGRPVERKKPADPPSAKKPEVSPPQNKEVAPANDGAAGDNRLLKTLSSTNALFMQELINLYNKKSKLAGQMAWLENGFGISDTQITSLGLNVVDLLSELQVKQWLWIDKTKPSRNMHGVEHKGKQIRWVIIKEPIAKQVGFNEE